MRRSKLRRLQSLLELAAKPQNEKAPQWVQPGDPDAYKSGDRVTHKGKVWRSIVNRNTWEPGVHGWEETS